MQFTLASLLLKFFSTKVSPVVFSIYEAVNYGVGQH